MLWQFFPMAVSAEFMENCRYVYGSWQGKDEFIIQTWLGCASFAWHGRSLDFFGGDRADTGSGRLYDIACLPRAASGRSADIVAARTSASRTPASGLERALSGPRFRAVCKLGSRERPFWQSARSAGS